MMMLTSMQTGNGAEDGDRQLDVAGQAGAYSFEVFEDGQAGHRADHQHIAVGEVNQVQHAVHHGVAQRDQCVHAAEHQSIDNLLDKSIHAFCVMPAQTNLTKTAPGEVVPVVPPLTTRS
jgi:urease alpha subunit